MAISLPDARSLSAEALEAPRWRALRGCEMGLGHAAVAPLLGVCPETVSRWWTACTSTGLDALPGERTGRPVGSGRLLSDEQAARSHGLIDSKGPDQSGIAAPLWSRRAARDLILKELGLRLPIRTVGKNLKRWGDTAKRPRRHSKDQGPEEVRAWLEEAYPLTEAQAKQEGAEIHRGDEAGVAADEHPRLGYARQGQRATIKVPGGHIRSNMLPTISTEGALRFMTCKGAMAAALSLVFLSRLPRTTTRKILLTVGRLPGHVAAKVGGWVEKREGRIELFYLPRYAGELNPDEYLNNDLKGNVHEGRWPDSEAELRAQIRRRMRIPYHWPARVASYFQHPCVQYAAGP